MESPLLGAAREIPGLGRTGSVFGLASLDRRNDHLGFSVSAKEKPIRQKGTGPL